MNTDQQAALRQFNSLVGIRFQLYNSLFTSLPFHRIENTGILLSLFLMHCEERYSKGDSPMAIIDSFLRQYTPYKDDNEKYGLLFRFIQYAERQIVLFDALEDASFPAANDVSTPVDLKRVADVASTPGQQPGEVRLVLTAHPTQFYPGSVLGIISDLSNALKEDNPQKINDYLLQLGRTPFFNKEKPTPYDEAVNLMWYLEHIFYSAVGNVMCEVRSADDDQLTHPLVSIGFWPGGDRDGNPFVKTDTTLQVAAALHRRILRCYHRDVRELKRRLTFKGVEAEVARLERILYAALYTDDTSLTVPTILGIVYNIRNMLQQEHGSLFIDLIDEFCEKVKAFGLHFASLDIRQDSTIHLKTFAALAGQVDGLPANYTSLSEIERVAVLSAIPEQQITIRLPDEVSQDTLDVIAAIRTIQATNGEAGCHRYIISHCTSASNVLEVYAMFLLTGWKSSSLTVDIVPLFESIDDLQACAAQMEILYNNPTYRTHLERRGQRQTIMLGFSDGTKDGGYLMANWAIYKAKESLTALARRYGIEVVFFDGRGGPPARGGGKTQKFYASMGNNIAASDIQLTIQGQTISSNFGTIPTAQYNIEQLVAAGIAGRLRAALGPTLSPEEDELMGELASLSYDAYVALKNMPSFMDYLNEISPMRFYADTNIGSRPAKRSATKQLTLDDLRAIPYVGAWSQLKQNVPGYYGVGTALAVLKAEGRWQQVADLYSKSAFFRTLIDNCEMSMKKNFFPLTAYLANDERYHDIWNMVYQEHQLTQRLLIELTGQTTLMSANPVTAKSIEMRDRVVLPLLTIQQYALEALRNPETPESDTLEKLVIRCSFGIINAGRNAV